MGKTLIVSLFAFFSSVPALAKPHDVYPVSCDVLWAAVVDVLGNPRDYGLVGMSDSRQTATFIVVGEATQYADTVALTGQGDGCAMNLKMSQVGADNSDERGFRKRLGKSLAKLQAARPAKPSPAPGSM